MLFRKITLVVVLLSHIYCAYGKETKVVKFPKDQRMDIRFPPDIEPPSSPELPIGHLRPLGHQRRSSGEVSKGTFADWNQEGSLLFRGSLQNETMVRNIWPNASQDGQKSNVAKRKRGSSTYNTYMKLNTFLENYGSEEWILDQVLSKSALANIQMPPEFQCLSNNLLYVSSSMTDGKTSDDVKVFRLNKIQCILKGRRDYIIMEKQESTRTASTDNPQAICGMEEVVDIDPDNINVFDNPWVISTDWKHASLYTGDCILLPAGTVFHTLSYGECETLTFNWKVNLECKSDINKKSYQSVTPFLCLNDKNEVRLCDCNQLDSTGRWQQLLSSVLDSGKPITKSCLQSISSNKDASADLYELLDTALSTGEQTEKLPAALIHQIRNLACPTDEEIKQHTHDEL